MFFNWSFYFFSFKILEKVLNHSDFIAESFAGYALIIAVSLFFYMYVLKHTQVL